MERKPPQEVIAGSGARLSEDPADLLVRVAFAAETEGYPNLWTWISIADLAHVRELMAAGIIHVDEGQALLRGLLQLHEQPAELDPAAGDIVNNRDRLLGPLAGRAAAHLHTARARREATTVGWHLASRQALDRSAMGVGALIESIIATARQHFDTVMPDFTYLQHAQPTSLAHYLLTFAAPLSRDLDRLAQAFSRINRSPAGSGSTNGSRFPIDRNRLAASMEFPSLVRHARDAMWAPDLAIEAMAAIASALTTIDRLAEELQLWASSEFGFFLLADRHTRTSVIMPQKRNPYSLAMIRGIGREHLGALVSTIATNLTPSGQPDNRVYSYGAVPRAANTLGDAAALLADVIAAGRFMSSRLRESAWSGFTMATDVCDLLTSEHGLANRDAHRLVGAAVRHAEASGRVRVSKEDLVTASQELGIDPPPIEPETLDGVQEPDSVFGLRVGLGSLADVVGMADELEMAAARVNATTDGFEERFLSTTRRLTGELDE